MRGRQKFKNNFSYLSVKVRFFKGNFENITFIKPYFVSLKNIKSKSKF